MFRRGSIFWIAVFVVALLAFIGFGFVTQFSNSDMTSIRLLLTFGREYLVLTVVLLTATYMLGDGRH